jgi:hypothetical protein
VRALISFLINAPGDPKVFRSRGLLQEPVEICHSTLTAIGTFVLEGVQRILEGPVRGLPGDRRGDLARLPRPRHCFTVGHSVTLAAGSLGLVPAGAWFVPAVETGIALSIIYAAVIAIRPYAGAGGQTNKRLRCTTKICASP